MARIDALRRKVQNKLDLLRNTRAANKPPERQQIIDSAIPYVERMDFWCDRCEEDFTAPAHKIVITAMDPPVAVYEGECQKQHRCRRRITDQANDPYYVKSRVIREMQRRYAKDLLQPGQPGFNTLYGDPNKAFYQQLEESERQQWKRRPMVKL